MYSLFIDTHDKKVVIVLFKDGLVFNEKSIVSNNKHSEVTIPTLSNLLNEANLKVKDIGEVIVVNGPGSFTGERIAVTIAKTIAYCLDIPIKVVDSLTLMAIQLDSSIKAVSIEDRNGAFVGIFDSDNVLKGKLEYLNKSSYLDFKKQYDVCNDVDIDYNKCYQFIKKLKPVKAHEVKPLYVKGISALNDK